MAAVTLDQAKAFLRYDDESEDATIALVLSAAQDWVERHTGHALTQREFTQGVKTFCGPISLDWWPVFGPVTISYVDTDGEPQTINDARLIDVMRPASVYAASGAQWPMVDYGGQHAVTYTAGYATPDDVPAGLLLAMLVHAGMTDEQRGGDTSAAAWEALYNLCALYRLPGLA